MNSAKRNTPDDQAIVYVIDDNPDFRQMICDFLQDLGHKVVVFPEGRPFLDVVSPDDIGCIILDFNLPEINGFAIIDSLIKRGIKMPVIFTSGFLDTKTVVSAMKAGCFDVIEKGQDEISRLRATITNAIALDLERQETKSKSDKIARRRSTLTPREQEVMDLVVTGKRTKEIASDLGISASTVEIHRARVMRKMGADTVVDLVRSIFPFGQ